MFGTLATGIACCRQNRRSRRTCRAPAAALLSLGDCVDRPRSSAKMAERVPETGPVPSSIRSLPQGDYGGAAFAYASEFPTLRRNKGICCPVLVHKSHLGRLLPLSRLWTLVLPASGGRRATRRMGCCEGLLPRYGRCGRFIQTSRSAPRSQSRRAALSTLPPATQAAFTVTIITGSNEKPSSAVPIISAPKIAVTVDLQTLFPMES